MLIHEQTEALARLTTLRSPTSDSEIYRDLPDPLPVPTEDDIKAPHPKFTLLFGKVYSIIMIEVIGPPLNIKVDCVITLFAF